LHRQRLGEQSGITPGNAGAAAFAHADFHDTQRLERAHGVARHDPAGAETRRQFLFGAEEIAGLELLGEQIVAATICADSDDERPANMMRAVNSPLIATGCRNACAIARSRNRADYRGRSWTCKDTIL
jgi:hypothetical protein